MLLWEQQILLQHKLVSQRLHIYHVVAVLHVIILDAQHLHNHQEQVFVMMCVIKFIEGMGLFRSLPSFFSVILPALILCSCITKFEAEVGEVAGILVVEGIITDDESVITLSRSKGLSFEDNIFDLSPYHVTDAKVYIECDDGTQWSAAGQDGGQYTIQMGKLNPARQYRLKIEHEAHEYCSEYLYPVATPDIDSVFWTKRDKGQPVNLHVASHAPDDKVYYFRWSYTELWESRAKVYLKGYPYYCITNSKSKEMLLGTTEGTAFGQSAEIIAKIPPGDNRFKILYCMDVSQYTISKRAYDYFSNIKKNSRQSGSPFAQVPSELKGNIACITDSERLVIGYMVISSAATRKRVYIYNSEVYEDPELVIPDELRNKECAIIHFDTNSDPKYVPYLPPYIYILRTCVDCIAAGGRPINELPNDWPYKYGED